MLDLHCLKQGQDCWWLHCYILCQSCLRMFGMMHIFHSTWDLIPPQFASPATIAQVSVWGFASTQVGAFSDSQVGRLCQLRHWGAHSHRPEQSRFGVVNFASRGRIIPKNDEMRFQDPASCCRWLLLVAVQNWGSQRRIKLEDSSQKPPKISWNPVSFEKLYRLHTIEIYIKMPKLSTDFIRFLSISVGTAKFCRSFPRWAEPFYLLGRGSWHVAAVGWPWHPSQVEPWITVVYSFIIHGYLCIANPYMVYWCLLSYMILHDTPQIVIICDHHWWYDTQKKELNTESDGIIERCSKFRGEMNEHYDEPVDFEWFW